MPANGSAPPNLGVVVSVHGSIVDIRFDERLPPIYFAAARGSGTTDRH
jgi:F-type H+-transporting ATPase subunit beta